MPSRRPSTSARSAGEPAPSGVDERPQVVTGALGKGVDRPPPHVDRLRADGGRGATVATRPRTGCRGARGSCRSRRRGRGGRAGRSRRKRRDVGMPDSSRASRVAACHTEASPGSKWPPNWNHSRARRCSVSRAELALLVEHDDAAGEVSRRAGLAHGVGVRRAGARGTRAAVVPAGRRGPPTTRSRATASACRRRHPAASSSGASTGRAGPRSSLSPGRARVAVAA